MSKTWRPRPRDCSACVMSIDKQQLTLYSDGQPIAHSRVSTGTPRSSDPDRRVQRHPEGSLAPLQSLRRRPDVLHAADHLVRRGHASGHRAELSGVARLHPAARGLRPAVVGHHQARRARHRRARRGHARSRSPMRSCSRSSASRSSERSKLAAGRAGSSTSVVQAAYGALEIAQLTTARRQHDRRRAKPGDPALDAIASDRAAQAPATSSEVVRSAMTRSKHPGRPPTVADRGGRDRPLKPGPVSVFISRKEGKLFVRKGFDPVFDAPVTFDSRSSRSAPTSTRRLALKDDNATMRWNVMSMPGGVAAEKSRRASGNRRTPHRTRPKRSIASPSRRMRSIGFPS